jgi:glycosyltransferase involved in cell wall biosynthesis
MQVDEVMAIKVLQINKLYYPHIGGVESVVQDIAEGLKNEVQMEVLVCQPKGKTVSDNINGVEVFRASSVGIYFSMPVSFSFLKMFRDHIRDIDIIQFHSPFPLGEFISLFVNSKGAKKVVWWHADITKQKFLLNIYKPFLLRFLKSVDRIIVATPNHIQSSRFLPDFKEKCSIIPFGIDVSRFEADRFINEKADEIRNQYRDEIILFVGRLIYYKGIEFLIESMVNVNATLLIIGEGPLRKDLIKKCCALNINHKVIFLGRISDEEMVAYYHACDVFVLPSIENSEAFGLVQLEAMACHKPVINTNLPTGVPYVSIDGVTGLTVPPKDSQALSNAINSLLNDSELRKKMGENAYDRVTIEFSRKAMLHSILALYESLLDANTAISS